MLSTKHDGGAMSIERPDGRWTVSVKHWGSDVDHVARERIDVLREAERWSDIPI